jgi:hypothetical protein
VDHLTRRYPQDDGVGLTTSVPATDRHFVYFGCVPIGSDRQKPRLLFHTYVASWTPWGSTMDRHMVAVVYQGRTVFGQIVPCPRRRRKLATSVVHSREDTRRVEAAADAFEVGRFASSPTSQSVLQGGSRSHYEHVIRNRQVDTWLRCYQESPSFLCLETGVKSGTFVDYGRPLYEGSAVSCPAQSR